jgi:acyl carrier protein
MTRAIVGWSAWERTVSDVSAEVRDILAFHLGAEEQRLTDDTRLHEDLGADSLDVVEIVMSCEERFGVEIPNRAATTLSTVGDAVRCVEAQIEALAAVQAQAKIKAIPPARTKRLRLALR